MGCASIKPNEQQQKQLSKRFEHSTAMVGDILNNIRKKPTQYAKVLQKQLKNFQDKKVMKISLAGSCDSIQYQTIQGPQAWRQAIKFLKNCYTNTIPLVKNSVLCQAAANRALQFIHKDNKEVRSHRVEIPLSHHDIRETLKKLSGVKLKQGEYATLVGMDFKLLGRNSLENAVLGLIVDDGIPDRKNRNLLFSDKFKYYGSYVTMTKDHVVVVLCLSSQNITSQFK